MERDAGNRIRRQFAAANKIIRNLPKNGSFKPSHELMLKFYAFYKQATDGQCRSPKPNFWDMVGKAKWEAWNSLDDMSPEDAMEGYVAELKQIVEMMPLTEEVNGLVTEFDSFFELVNIETGAPVAQMSGDGPLESYEQPLSNGLSNGYEPSPGDGETEQFGSPQPPDVTTDSASAHTADEPTGEYSDSDGEEFMDSSDVVLPLSEIPNESQSVEKTVDLLASCAGTSPSSSSTSGLHSSHVPAARHVPAVGQQPFTRSKVPNSKSHRVSFLLPDKESSPTEEVNEKLRMALLNMQEEINSLEKRLSLVEQITVNQRKRQLDKSRSFMKWWPFPGLHPRTAAFVLLWPVVLGLLVHLAKHRRRR